MGYRFDTYCGLYCGACEVLRANREGRIAQTAKRWRMKPGDIVCHGCKSPVVSVYCRKCGIKSCAIAKRVDDCTSCGKFPCRKLSSLSNDGVSHHAVVLANLANKAVSGTRAWLRQQDRRWRCQSCGRRFSWYAKKCGSCGAAVRNAVAEDRDRKQQARGRSG
ncbi:DUF3795 domain-containing protein [bacterium]|nr:DUF3795 domain-containing protein [bacterium]